jgi:hypothetical protein
MSRDEHFHIEINCQQLSRSGERVCGDIFLSKGIREESRMIAVLSDGIGHGIKANLLATLASTLAADLSREHKKIDRIAKIIMNTLPYDKEKKLNFATFTILDLDQGGKVSVLEYENPKTLFFRGSRVMEPVWNCIVLDELADRRKELMYTSINASKEDRIVFFTDGVIQSGLGKEKYPEGWRQDNVKDFILDIINNEHDISASRLASLVVNKANQNDEFIPRDDISCAVAYFREPRRLLICTGPPADPQKDAEFADKLLKFHGRKLICGATTANMIAREWDSEIVDETEIHDHELPPKSHMPGVDLVTEGILTLSKVNELLKQYNQNTKLGNGPADEIVKIILVSDEIHFLAGTAINVAHQDPSLPIELELRRTVVHRIVRVLFEKFLKEAKITFY